LILCVKLIQPHDVVGATRGPKLRIVARKSAEGKKVIRWCDLATIKEVFDMLKNISKAA